MSEEIKEGIPLLGDEFPKIEVQTTHGVIKLPLRKKWFVLSNCLNQKILRLWKVKIIRGKINSFGKKNADVA